MTGFSTIITEQHKNVLRITLNRPDRLNALTIEMLKELLGAFQNARTTAGVRAIVLTGAGRGFCAGQDLGVAVEQGAGSAEFSYGAHLNNTYNPLIQAMRSLPKPIIGAINGVAAGAGMSLALACDLRICAESAVFLQAFARVGLVPDSGSTWFLSRLIGEARALEMMLSGRKVSAQEALKMGFVNQVVSDDQLDDITLALAAELADGPTQAFGLTKRAVYFASEHDLDSALAMEAACQDEAGRTADHIEGLAAFLEKRTPRFRGE